MRTHRLGSHFSARTWYDDFGALFGGVNLAVRVRRSSKPFQKCVKLTRKEGTSFFQYGRLPFYKRMAVAPVSGRPFRLLTLTAEFQRGNFMVCCNGKWKFPTSASLVNLRSCSLLDHVTKTQVSCMKLTCKC